MGINTRSKFYYLDPIDRNGYTIDFLEPNADNVELTASLNVGSYSHSQLKDEIERALNASGTQTYTVTLDRSTRIFTIASTDIFSILGATGSTVSTTALTVMGFNLTDVSGLSSYDADSASGSEYKPQFYLQDYLDKDDNEEAVDASINESSDGTVEVLTYGFKSYVEFNIRPINQISYTKNSLIETDLSAVANVRAFLSHCIRKRNVEFMKDRDTVGTFDILLLEETAENQKGVGYKLKELRDLRLQEWYQTGRLKFRVIE